MILIVSNAGNETLTVTQDIPPQNTFDLVSFNVYVGGGIDTTLYWAINEGWKYNRVPDIISTLKKIDATFVCLQEVVLLWQENDNAILNDIADKIGLSYYFYNEEILVSYIF